MLIFKKDFFFSFFGSVVLLFSLGASAEEAKYICTGPGNTGGTFSGVFTASSAEEAAEKAIKAFGKHLVFSIVECKKQ